LHIEAQMQRARSLPVVTELANRHTERTVFTRFIPPERPDQMPGIWQRYYTRWRVATRDCLDRTDRHGLGN
jgi:hypothetical protein